jgi:hypothetical protein
MHWVYRIWIWLFVVTQLAGWTLSAVGQLNRVGYICFFLLAVPTLRWIGWPNWRYLTKRRVLHRFKRPFAFAYLCLACMVLVSALLYKPSNFDALAYRIPRVLNWLAEEQWWWIPHLRGWLNTRACGIEWFTAPMLLFLKTDRFISLVNVACFLMLPGLIFSFLRHLGFGKKFSWNWMWVLSSACCYVLQAGSIGNDLFSAVHVLIAMNMAFTARKTKRIVDVWYACLAAGAMTAVKISNLVLLLPWLFVIAPALLVCFKRPLATIAVACVTFVASFMPTAVLNYIKAGNWTASNAEHVWVHPPSASVALLHNFGLFISQNLPPPIWPFSKQTNAKIESLLPEHWKEILDNFAEGGRSCYGASEFFVEENSGLGTGILFLLVGHVVCGVLFRNKYRRFPISGFLKLFLLTPWISVVVFLSKSGLQPLSRNLTAIYILLVPTFMIFCPSFELIRRRWWQLFAWVSFAFSALLLIINPARPLWPALNVLNRFKESPSPYIKRALDVYQVYRERYDWANSLTSQLPLSVKAIGLVTACEAETPLWRPFGSRRVYHVMAQTNINDLRKLKITHIVVHVYEDDKIFGIPINEWIKKMNAEIVYTDTIRILASNASQKFLIVQCNDLN